MLSTSSYLFKLMLMIFWTYDRLKGKEQAETYRYNVFH